MGTGNESVGIPGAGPTAFPYFSTKNILVIKKKNRHNRLQEASSELSSVIDSFTVFFLFFVKFGKVKLPKSVEATGNNVLKSVRLPSLRVIW